MKKLTLSVITYFIMSPFAYAQNGAITGQLIDSRTSKPASDIPVILYGTPLGVKTDPDGKFEITNLKLKETELLVHGSQLIGQSQHIVNNCFTISLRNIPLGKKNKTIDLGTIYLVHQEDEALFDALPCAVLNANGYRYSLVDGKDRFVNGKYVLIDFSNPSGNCNKN